MLEVPLKKNECYGRKYGRDFYSRRPDRVAMDLLGSLVIAGERECVIVETEAYFGDCDPGSRASKYKGGRIRERLFGEPGKYLIYGMHGWLLTNIVAHEPGRGGAVLVRSCYSPKEGVIEGPGKVSRYLGITMDHDGAEVGEAGSPAVLCGYLPGRIARLYRVNVNRDFEEPLRFADETLFKPRSFRPRATVKFILC